MMTLEWIRDLIRVAQETGVAELEVQQGEDRVWIKVPAAGMDAVPPAPTPLPAPAGVTALASPPPVKAEPAAHVAPVKEEELHELVKSPIVGTYYDAPSPGAAPFVKVGDRVKPKQVLCIIESMKLMNEIEAEQAGVIVAKHVESGRPVEYGELLFSIRPL